MSQSPKASVGILTERGVDELLDMGRNVIDREKLVNVIRFWKSSRMRLRCSSDLVKAAAAGGKSIHMY